jgi:RNA polymerase sigma-70 factor (ECF subfamily)
MERAGPDLHVVSEATPAAEPARWEAIYRETAVMVYRFLYARVGNRPDAEDLTTQVYMRALPRLRLVAVIEEIRSYLLATARTVLADHWRKHYDVQVATIEDGMASTPAADLDPTSDDNGIRRANAVLARLPVNYRQVLEFRFLRGYSLRETADAMGVSVANAKVLQHRALRRAAGQEFPA